MSRLNPIPVEHMSEEMRREWEILARWQPPVDGVVGGPYDAWLRSPELLHRLQGLGGFFWNRTSLDRGLVEYAIALTSRHWRCNVEWLFHYDRALQYGVDRSDLDRLFDGDPPSSGRQDLHLAFDLATALLEGEALSDELYSKASALLGERGLVELTTLVGYYSLVAFTLRTFDIESRDRPPGPFARPAERRIGA